jgi:hypothetical protein
MELFGVVLEPWQVYIIIGVASLIGTLVKAYVPALNPCRESMIRMMDKIPIENADIAKLAGDLGEIAAQKIIEKKLL